MKSATIKRNATIVGSNCASYDDKHPENPVSLRPIHRALNVAFNNRQTCKVEEINAMRNWSKPNIARGLAALML